MPSIALAVAHHDITARASVAASLSQRRAGAVRFYDDTTDAMMRRSRVSSFAAIASPPAPRFWPRGR